jgi:outer membrane lipoprotein-sorting protein
MQRIRWKTIIIALMATILFSPIVCAITGVELLKKVEKEWNYDNSKSDFKVTLKSNGKVEEGLVGEMYQKNKKEKQIIKFLEPAHKKGITLLIVGGNTPTEKIYLYYPKYKKVRTIAAHIKNQSFEGTDFSIREIGERYSNDDYVPKILESTNPKYSKLELIPKSKDSNYSKLILTVKKNGYMLKKVEFYGKMNNVLYKTLEMFNEQEFDGKNIYVRWEMNNIKKKHSTIIDFHGIEFNAELKDSLFNKRIIQR